MKAQTKENLSSAVNVQTEDSLKVKVPNRLFNDLGDRSTGAISTVGSKVLYKTPSPSLTNSLFGVLPGLNVQQTSGEPGFEDANLNIRGIGTYGFTNGNGYNTHAIFVDGFEVNANYFNFLSASEIESVSIFKDAAALATFGMKGANGVIWVTTKRGVEGKS
ncbi:MAG TPA: TonB-dependent receptor plug domain-containing protein, partial [Pelobium sp.]|nr:TonB-dependent receptor plug domain-containing protein [Pelobium sp.]